MATKKGSGLVFRLAQRRGLLGGSRPWLYVWILLMARRVLRRLTSGAPEVVYREDLLPGQAVVISAQDSEPRIIGR